MTETEWISTDDFQPIHEYLWDNAKSRPRKYRLASCGIYRLTWQLFSDKLESAFIELGEAFADDPSFAGQVGAYTRVDQIPATFPFDVCFPSDHRTYDSNNVSDVMLFVSDRLGELWREQYPVLNDDDEDEILKSARQKFTRQAGVVGAIVLRDIFGNPFRPVTVESSWLTSTVTALATGIYAEKAFDRLPILADALMDAGCANDDLLNHLRSDGPHVRGCWALDLVLGKT
ncbi:hypothetical protein VT84_30245 [Gemmata sp. SH-PL17]|uniref:hypothetical protein n=1 Tax=Gemmata sp. SH-PL17 TaxID=1630693 RepID=UPI00078DB3E6|nr:hypothetical protein [Gemmata sp. SH-PL17]AMV28725.1 hypothetical protein VT84_30245 [Gemmata sp. SH-PL17]